MGQYQNMYLLNRHLFSQLENQKEKKREHRWNIVSNNVHECFKLTTHIKPQIEEAQRTLSRINTETKQNEKKMCISYWNWKKKKEKEKVFKEPRKK